MEMLPNRKHDENPINFRKVIAFIKNLHFTSTKHSKEIHGENHKDRRDRVLTTWRDIEGIIYEVKENFGLQEHLDQMNGLEAREREEITNAEKSYDVCKKSIVLSDRSPQEKDEDVAAAQTARDTQISKIKLDL